MGTPFNYAFTVANAASAFGPATSVTIKDLVPAGISITGVPTGANVASATCTPNTFPFAGNGSSVLTCTVKPGLVWVALIVCRPGGGEPPPGVAAPPSPPAATPAPSHDHGEGWLDDAVYGNRRGRSDVELHTAQGRRGIACPGGCREVRSSVRRGGGLLVSASGCGGVGQYDLGGGHRWRPG